MLHQLRRYWVLLAASLLLFIGAAAVELNSSEMTCEIGDFGECWCREHRSVSWAPFYVCATPREVLQGPKLGDIRYPEGDPTE